MSTQHNTPTNLKQQSPPKTRLEILANLAAAHPISRRQLIPNLLAAITLGRLALSGGSIVSPPEAIEYAPTIPAPYGPAERTAHIDKCAQMVDETIQALEKFWSFLLATRALPPSEVDGCELLEVENTAHAAMDDLTGTIESSTDFEEVFKWATGKRAYFWCLKGDIIGNERYNFSRDEIQLEIDAFRKDEPAIADELQGLLNAKYGGAI